MGKSLVMNIHRNRVDQSHSPVAQFSILGIYYNNVASDSTSYDIGSSTNTAQCKYKNVEKL